LLIVGERDFPMLEGDARRYADKDQSLGLTMPVVVVKGCNHMQVVGSLLEDRSPVRESAGISEQVGKKAQVKKALQERDISFGLASLHRTGAACSLAANTRFLSAVYSRHGFFGPPSMYRTAAMNVSRRHGSWRWPVMRHRSPYIA
jgi:hypothetical protein